jgi:phosphoribosylformylglycinamidine cyclo-ligase
MELLGHVEVRALAHVTGGGIPGNLARVLPPDVDAVVHRGRWEEPRIFAEIQRLGAVPPDEMARVFNLGVGMIAVVAPADEHRATDVLRAAGLRAGSIGEVVPGGGHVRMVDAAGGTGASSGA